MDFMKLSIRENPSMISGCSTGAGTSLRAVREERGSPGSEEEEEQEVQEKGVFRPILFFIPLRLGQDRFNEQYKDSLKVCVCVCVCVCVFVCAKS